MGVDLKLRKQSGDDGNSRSAFLLNKREPVSIEVEEIVIAAPIGPHFGIGKADNIETGSRLFSKKAEREFPSSPDCFLNFRSTP
ncbi:MAG: hypothetical protein AAFV29_04960, partial [Myxococcota bacterium]